MSPGKVLDSTVTSIKIPLVAIMKLYQLGTISCWVLCKQPFNFINLKFELFLDKTKYIGYRKQ